MGRDQLSRRLGIHETVLDAWILGNVTTIPDGKLLILAAILEEAANTKK
jgi:DNA-binding transcriptional regulator YdaS (Cro superfamily)